MPKRNKLALFGQLVAGLLAQFAQRDLFSCLRAAFVTIVDLTRRHFPNRLADRNALLVNENDFSVLRHRRNNDSGFAMHDCPQTRLASRRRLYMISDNFDMRIDEMALTRDGFPIALFHPGSVVAAVLSGKRRSGVWSNAERSLRRAPLQLRRPVLDLRHNVLGRRRAIRPPLRKRTAHFED